jgi:tetratricopeptide (TPR) repeat protein
VTMGALAGRGRKAGAGALPLLTAAILLWGGALALQAYREARHPLPQISTDILYFRGGAAVSRAALGFDALLADIYWIRAIQHFGGTRRAQETDKSYRLLYPLLDLATTLDPFFNIAYRFGAIFLSEPHPAGPGRTDLAIALLERGLAADPARWQYAQDAGFVHYWWRQDYKAAAAWFDRASRIEGAPWWLRSMAASVLAEGGDRQSSRQLWQQLYETTDDAWVRNNAHLKLSQLQALDEMDALALVVRRFTETRGRPPASWQELVAMRWLTGVPVDPSGTPYELKPGAPGGVALSPRSSLAPLPPQFTTKTGPTT